MSCGIWRIAPWKSSGNSCRTFPTSLRVSIRRKHSNTSSGQSGDLLAPHSLPIDKGEEFVREFSQVREFLASYIHALLPNAADAEDVLQRCSILLWQKFDEYDRSRSFRGWACGVAFYEVRNFLRSASRKHLQFNSELMSQLADQRIAEVDGREGSLLHLQACLKLIKASDRELIKKAYETSRGLKGMAEVNGVKLKSLYHQLWRIRKVLAECVQKKLAIEGSE
ncbi:sigma factor [Planctomicrobium sp. SH661]|uniref:sigma factor n=1 Tax=Planctomicrobium sp. SH661 TaxID=3448124 RepID=UPI003F5B9F2C